MITSYEIQYDSCEKNKSAHLRMKSRGHVIIIFEDFLSIFCAFFFFIFFFYMSQLATANKNHYLFCMASGFF